MNESEAMEVHCSGVSFTPVDAEDANTVPTARAPRRRVGFPTWQEDLCVHIHTVTPPPPPLPWEKMICMPPESGIWKKELISGLEKPQNETDSLLRIVTHCETCVVHSVKIRIHRNSVDCKLFPRGT
jgi:hypothetical protein